MFLHLQRVFTAKAFSRSARGTGGSSPQTRGTPASCAKRSKSPSWTGVRQIAFPQKLPPLPRFLAQQLLQEVTLINTEIVLIFHISSEKTQPVFGNPNERCYTGVFPKVSTLKSKPVPKCKMQTHTEISSTPTENHFTQGSAEIC